MSVFDTQDTPLPMRVLNPIAACQKSAIRSKSAQSMVTPPPSVT